MRPELRYQCPFRKSCEGFWFPGYSLQIRGRASSAVRPQAGQLYAVAVLGEKLGEGESWVPTIGDEAEHNNL